MVYCQTILLAGYLLFFTDSLIIFFFAYEMLLIPSFFILYKFAKTRRCIEAAYLMFFWTQFGALFLIFGFLYLFLIVGTSSFELISNIYFSPFEVNFLFLCFLIGFGVKLPIWPFYYWINRISIYGSYRCVIIHTLIILVLTATGTTFFTCCVSVFLKKFI
jgi:NADH:ubiquinone oxidoreductase subunit 4 (subunit M)